MKLMKQFKRSSRILALVLALMLAFTACSKSDNKKNTTNANTETNTDTNTATSTPAEESPDAVQMEDTTIKIRVMNDYGNIDPIIAEYENRVKDDPIMSKIHLEFEYVGGGDYKDKLAMTVSAQEDYDLMFCGSWQGQDGYISSGAFKDLKSYFLNDKFPGLKSAFTEDFLQPHYTYQKNDSGEFEAKLYTIPLAQAYYDLRGLSYREDLRVKYNIPEITNDDIMMQYVQAIQKNEPDMIPLSMWNGFFYWENVYFKAAQNHIYTVEPVGQEAPIYVAVSPDGKTVLDAVVMGDSQDQFSSMPEGYQYDFIKEYQLGRLKWADYMDPVRGTTETSVGVPAVEYCTLSEFQAKRNDLAVNEEILAEHPDASIRFYPTEESQRNMEPGAIVSDMKSGNTLVVPAWSEKTDAVMYFLDWMFGTEENHDLMQYGIEGVNWEASSPQTFTLLDAAEDVKYTMPGYSFTWNPTYVRYDDKVAADSELKGWYDYMLNPDSYTPSAISGFKLNTAPVETEIANVSALSNELLLRFALHGADTEAVIDKFNADAKKAGLEKIRTEVMTQLQEFLDMKNSAK